VHCALPQAGWSTTCLHRVELQVPAVLEATCRSLVLLVRAFEWMGFTWVWSLRVIDASVVICEVEASSKGSMLCVFPGVFARCCELPRPFLHVTLDRYSCERALCALPQCPAPPRMGTQRELYCLCTAWLHR
jgi:hypothetical protein